MPKPLTIGVDVRDLRVAKTGTRTYLLELCHEFKKLESDTLHFEFLDTSSNIYTGSNKLLKWVAHFRYQSWKQLVLPLKAWSKHCDILFCTDNFVPLIHIGYKTIPVFHDAFFFEMPEQYGKLWLWLYKKTALPAARRSFCIITPTLHAKKQIAHFTGIKEDKLRVVFEGPGSNIGLSPAVGLAALQLPLISKKYILHVGSFFKRKNLPALVHAFAQLKRSGYADLKLVLAGPLPNNVSDNDHQMVINAIEQENLQSDVIITGYLSDEAIAVLYQNALLYVFPSINEGFGIPVLDAFAHSLPVVVANNSCLPEVGGDAVITFDPFDVDDIASTIRKVLNSEELQKEMISKGHERLKEFSWQRAAIQLVAIFKEAANN